MNKLKILTVIFVLVVSGIQSAYAQKYYSYYSELYFPMWYNSKYYFPKENITREMHVEKVLLIETNYKSGKASKQKVIRAKKYDQNGNEAEFFNFNRKGKIKYANISTFDTANYRTEQIINKRKRQISHIKAVYNQNGQCIEFAHYNKKGKPGNKMVYTWDSTKLFEAFSYKKGTDLKYKWVHEYYPNKTNKKITKYDSKGKIKKVWTYDCSILGEIQKKHEDTIKMCRIDSVDHEGLLYRVHRQSMENGKMYTTIYKYSKDSIYLGYKYYDHKNRMVSYSDTRFSGDTSINVYKSYNKNGKVKVSTLYKKDKQKRNLYTENCYKERRCANTKHVTEYFYDKKGLLNKEIHCKGKYLNYTLDYFYTFY
jgi:hypothetical protein